MLRALLRTVIACMALLALLGVQAIAGPAGSAGYNNPAGGVKKDSRIFQRPGDALQLTRELGAKGRIAYIEKVRVEGRDMYMVIEIYTAKTPQTYTEKTPPVTRPVTPPVTPKEQQAQPAALPREVYDGPVEAAAPAPVAPPVAPIKSRGLKKQKKDIDIFLKRENALRLANDLGSKGRTAHIEIRFVGAGEMYVVVEIYTAKTPEEQPPQLMMHLF